MDGDLRRVDIICAFLREPSRASESAFGQAASVLEDPFLAVSVRIRLVCDQPTDPYSWRDGFRLKKAGGDRRCCPIYWRAW